MRSVLLLGTFCAILLSGCANGGEKFVGRWKILTDRPLKDTLQFKIEENGDNYVLKRGSNNEIMSTLLYNKDTKTMTGDSEGMTIDVAYVDSTNHLLIGPRQLRRKVELEKAD